MGFRINTNIAAMNAHTAASVNNRNLDSSLSKLSSGLRINTAADDASGMAIADSLRSQASSLGQAVSNANDAIGIIQIADKAMDEQLKILDTIKVKATQAAQDGQTTDSRKALQKDIARLMESLNNIANTTSYNGQSLLSGSFNNKEFQVGAFSNETIKASIGSTNTSKIGSVRYESYTLTAYADTSMTINGTTIQAVNVSTSAGTGIGALAAAINKNSDKTGVRASYDSDLRITGGLSAGITSLSINGVSIGTISGTEIGDRTGLIVNAINAKKTDTGVEAYTDNEGLLHLRSTDGRGIQVSATETDFNQTFVGRLTLTQLDASDIDATGFGLSGATAQSFSLDQALKGFTLTGSLALGQFSSVTTAIADIGVTTLKGAMLVMNMAESAIKGLDGIRSDLGSVQNQLTSTINNISVTQVNVKAAESQIRDVDFAAESANFSKFNILAQSGSYAMSQANAVQQNVLKLLQ